ncbi:LamG-like jellyroll fold domain-containing protein [Dysgonomonas sp. BGC7]|uniref:LamG-like jellyroll fold domain-containing protein n=1 Tax=Dysgonomonas sp. BGC7 TaxID=1658008 RepID=UPI0006828B3F|nr:LamG-like jellyroll fold domain-containing protein [Dysgonomonas sp. BGC7]MBD8387145.1 LamG domain-containing protein [Dysgonomonas sp. BGC7]
MRKKLNYLLLIGLIIPLFIASCSDDDKDDNSNPAQELVVDNTVVTLLQGDEITINVTSGNGQYSIRSLDSSVADASVSGDKITIKSPSDANLGETTILIVDGRKKIAKVKVKVAKLWDLTVDNSSPEMFIGAVTPVKIETGNGGYEISLEAGGESVIELGPLFGQIFTVKALSEGNAKIIIKDKKEQIAEVNVLIKIVELELGKYELSLVGPNKTGDINILGGNGGYKFSYNPEGIATASEANNTITIKSVAVGTTTITVTDQKGATKDIEVTVLPKELETDIAALNIIGTRLSGKFNITEGNGDYSVVSENENLITASVVGSEVTVTAKKAGTTSVTITDIRGKSKKVPVTISPLAMNIGLDYCLIANYGALSNSADYKSLSQVTYEVKVKLAGGRGLQGFIGLEGNLLLRGERDALPQKIELVSKFNGTEQKLVTNPIMDANKWYHLVLVFDGTLSDPTQRHKLYINGELYTNFESSTAINFDRKTVDLTQTSNAPGLGLGRVGSDYWRGLSGVIGEARVWKVARTAEQIRNNACSLTESSPKGLISHWIFGYGIATPSIEDLAGTCDAVVYDNQAVSVTNPKSFPADKWVEAGCP